MLRATTSIQILLIVCLSALSVAMGLGAEELGRPDKLPATYRLIGHYQLISKLRVENSKSEAVVISPLLYRVYSDGMEVRVYVRASDEDSFTAYDIYRSDGVGIAKAGGEIEVVAGVQAFTTKGKMLRQISVTRNSFTMVKTPPRSHRVIITRAKAVAAPTPPSTAAEQ